MLLIIWFTFIGASAVLAIWHIFNLIAVAGRKEDDENEEAGVSVLVCAHNELENLKELIPKLLDQKHNDFEVLIADDRSEDGTYEYLKEITADETRIKHIRIDDTPHHINEKKYAIFLGIKSAKNDIILLTDADCRPVSDQWLRKMTAPFKNAAINIVLGFSLYEQMKGFLNSIIRYETYLTALSYLTFLKLGNPYMGVGRNMAYRKSFFLLKEGFKGYQKVLGGDDDLFVNKNAKKKETAVVLNGEAITFSKPKKTWREFYIQKSRHLSVGKLYRGKDKFLLGTIFLAKLLFWLTFIVLIVAEFRLILTVGSLIVVMVSFLIPYIAFRKRLNDSKSVWVFPLLDIVYLFYYLSVALKVRFTKKVKWS